MKKVVSIFILALFMAWAPSVYAQQDTTVGQHMKTGAKKTGHAVEKGAKTTGHVAKKGAQKTGHAAKKGGQAVGHGAKKVGQNTAEVASKGKAEITDKEIKTKQGPNGESIYQDKRGYYWIDGAGHKHYQTYGQLKSRS